MATNFFEQQAQARSATKKLVILYVLAVASITTVITMIFHFLFLVQSTRYARYDSPSVGVNPALDVIVALVVLAVIGLSTIARMLQLGGSGERVATLLGGTPVDPSTQDPLERRLMNVVEEMSIASGIPVPRVFVLQDERGINAFAAGLKPGQAVIGVTRGTLEQLTRDELQGVVAHEFSHIFNGDMRLNLRLMGVLGGILVLATIGRMLFQVSPRSRYSSDDRDDNGSAIVIFGIALFVVGWIGVFFARLIKAAVSRQREYLADASAVQYTRNPEGIGGALMKIRGFDDHSEIHSHYAEETSHMFFGTALDYSSLFATHPELEDRISRVDAQLLKPGGWTPHHAVDPSAAWPEKAETNRLAKDALSVLAGAAIGGVGARSPAARVVTTVAARNTTMAAPGVSSVTPSVGASQGAAPTAASVGTASGAAPTAASVVASIGAPQAADIAAAQAFLAQIPPAIRELTRDREGAVLLVLSLFLETETGTSKQGSILAETLGADEVREILNIRSQLTAMAEADRLSLLELSIPPLRQLTDQSKQMLLKLGHDLAHAEAGIDLYEYVALSMLEHQLMRDTRAAKPRPVITSQRTAGDLSVLFSAIAYAGADDVLTAKKAFTAGTSKLGQDLDFRALDECKLDMIADAIERLSYLEPASQKKVIEACVYTIMADGVATVKETELLRALCAVLEAPLPALAV